MRSELKGELTRTLLNRTGFSVEHKMLAIAKAKHSGTLDAHDGEALICTISCQTNDLVEALIEAGADIEARFPELPLTPIQVAISVGNFEAFNLLYDKGAKLDVCFLETSFTLTDMVQSAIDSGKLNIHDGARMTQMLAQKGIVFAKMNKKVVMNGTHNFQKLASEKLMYLGPPAIDPAHPGMVKRDIVFLTSEEAQRAAAHGPQARRAATHESEAPKPTGPLPSEKNSAQYTPGVPKLTRGFLNK